MHTDVIRWEIKTKFHLSFDDERTQTHTHTHTLTQDMKLYINYPKQFYLLLQRIDVTITDEAQQESRERITFRSVQFSYLICS